MRETYSNHRAQQKPSPASGLVAGIVCKIHEGCRKKGVLEPEVKCFKVGAGDSKNRNQHKPEQKSNPHEEDTAGSVIRTARTDRAVNRNHNQKCSVTEIYPGRAAASTQCRHHDDGKDAYCNRQLKACFDSKNP